MQAISILEPARQTPVQAGYDVIICGSGPAGIGAALSAARCGARTFLVEAHGCLGGVWTAGLLSLILDAKNKPGVIGEIRARLSARHAIFADRDLYDAEAMKLVLEEMCVEAGIAIRLHTKVVGVAINQRRLGHVILEGKEGRFAVAGNCFIDATGDGDLAALAGCGFELGRVSDGLMQPMSLMALLSGIPEEIRTLEKKAGDSSSCLPKDEFLAMLREAGHDPSYTKPSLFPLPNGLCALMANHQYEKSGLDSCDLTEATITARREIAETVAAMRRFPGDWSHVKVVATAEYIGVREGRRIHGLYHVTKEDIQEGKRHPDAITRVKFAVDVHSVKKAEGGGYGAEGIVNSQHYDIPLRALIARDSDNLLMAGRCISGDFHAHASYRVTGNAVATGEAAGVLAAIATREGRKAAEVSFANLARELEIVRTARAA